MTLQEKLEDAKKETLQFAKGDRLNSRFKQARKIKLEVQRWMKEPVQK